MKKIIVTSILLLVLISGLIFSFAPFNHNLEVNNKIKNSERKTSKPLSATESKAALKKWEASPDGIMFKKWEASPTGKKVQASVNKISKSVRNFTNIEGVVTSLTLPTSSRLGFGMMIKINENDYILAFGPEKSGNNELEQLHSLKVNDKIIIKTHSISKAPKYSYPIISGEYVERDSKVIYKHVPRKGGC